MGRILNTRQVTLLLAGVVLVVTGLAPVGVMIVASFSASGHLSTAHYIEALGNPRIWLLLANSLLLAMLTTTLAGIGGVSLGLMLGKTDVPVRNALLAILSIPLLFPPYMLAVGWFEVIGRSEWLFSLPGTVLVLTTAFLPVVLLITMAYLRAVSPGLEEAARLVCPWRDVLWGITIPLIAPGILVSLLLVFLLTVGEFGAPLFLRFDVFPVASFTQFAAFYNFGAATAAALPLLIIASFGLVLERRLIRAKSYQFRGRQNYLRIPLGRLRPVVAAAVIFMALLLIVLPIGALLWRGVSPGALQDAWNRAGASALRSAAYAAIAATVVTGIGLILGYAIERHKTAPWRAMDGLSFFLFTLPGTVTGVGLIVLWNRPALNWIYATPAMLLLAYVAQYSVIGIRITAAGLKQVPASMEEAAEIAGVTWRVRMHRVLIPLLAPILITAWSVTFIFCLRDVSLPLLLAPPGRDTLTARTMTLMANGSPDLIAALCLLIFPLAVIPLAALAAASRLEKTA
jgi:iron(III) transport system permease protein